MKTSILFTFSLLLFTCEAAIPLSWTVETTRAQPATFEAYQGETIDFEAALQSHGKPLEAPLNYSFFWQTNGMGNLYWEVKVKGEGEQMNDSTVHLNPSPSPTNVLFATWYPAYDVGAKVYNCFIGSPSNIYHAAFQLRLRPSPGALPNALPLPVPVIDFARVRVLNPPWSGGGGGVDTNAVIDIIHATVDGAARPLPRYLHIYDADDSYPEAAQEYYRSRGDGKTDGGCSAVRSGGYLYRNFDFPFDDRTEFIVRMSAGPNRFASVGVAQVGTNLTEQMVTSGKPEYSARYKWLPGATVDGINEHGVACNINVVDGDPQTSGWHNDTGDLHPLAAIRWILDNATNAQSAAQYIAANIGFPQGWAQNFHYMVVDATSTYIVENGSAHDVTDGVKVLTNFRLYPTRDTTGAGQERYDLLAAGAPITNAWFTRAYSPTANWRSEFKSIEEQNAATNGWARLGTMEARRATGLFWQSVHTSIYDLTNLVLRIAVQETDDWYTFQVPSSGAKIDAYTKAETDAKLAGKANKNGDINEVFSAEAVEVDSFLLVNGLQISNIDGDIEVAADSIRTPSDSLKEKANRPSSPYTFGNLASLDENGDLEDSGKTVDDFADKNGDENEDFSANMLTLRGGAEIDGTVTVYPIRENVSPEIRVTQSEVEGSTDADVTIFGSDSGTVYHSLRAKADRSMISATDPTFSNEVDKIVRSLIPTTLRAYDPVRQCWWNIQPVNGVLTLTVED